MRPSMTHPPRRNAFHLKSLPAPLQKEVLGFQSVQRPRWRSGVIRTGRTFDPVDIRCSFCGKRRGEVKGIVAGQTPAIAICNECVDLCREILDEDAQT